MELGVYTFGNLIVNPKKQKEWFPVRNTCSK